MSCSNDIFTSDPSLRFLNREGEMRRRIREYDWASTELGCPSQWASSLKTAISIMLDSAVPTYIGWGPRFVQLYNDAYIPVLGKLRHPEALGITTSETWYEIWDFVGPQFNSVLQEGRAISRENQMMPMLRNGYLEECYFTFSYNPLANEAGQAAGVFVTTWETTIEFVRNRRENTVRTLAENLSGAADMQQIYTAFEKTVLACPQDVPFGLWYKVREDRTGLSLCAAAAIERGGRLSPEFLDPASDDFYQGAVNIDQPATTIRSLSDDIPVLMAPFASSADPNCVSIMPLCDIPEGRPNAYIVLAINPMRPNDGTAAEFLEAIRVQLEITVRRVSKYDIERREREHQFYAVMSALPCMVWMSDTTGAYVFFNRAWLTFRDRTLTQELGTGWMEGIHPDDREIVRRYQRRLKNRISTKAEYRLLDANGIYRWILDEATPRYDIHNEYIGFIGTCFDISERKRNEQEILSSQRELRTLYERLQSAREEERLSLAREVHDQLGQLLSAAKIDIKLLEENFSSDARALTSDVVLQELRSAGQIIDRSLQVVRRLATELRPPELESQGLATAIAWHASDFERRTKIRCHVDFEDDLQMLSDTSTIALFRIFQEAMTNILRHAKASRVDISVGYRNCRVRLRVFDNGVGISRAHARSSGSIGIKGMRERAVLAGGRLVLGPVRGSCTLVSAILPLQQNDSRSQEVMTFSALRKDTV